MKTTKLNSQTYEYEITMYRMTSTGIQEISSLDYDVISQIKITNDLFELFPTISMTFLDTNGANSVNHFTDGNSFLNIYFKNKDCNEALFHTFILDDIEILDQNKSEWSISVKGFSVHKLKLDATIDYASTTAKDFISILGNIIKYSGLPYKHSHLNSGNSDTYISPCNYSIQQLINDLLLRSIKNDIFVTGYDMLKNQLEILSVKNEFSKDVNDIKIYNFNLMPTQDGFSDISLAANELTKNNYFTSREQIKAHQNIKFHDFDYNNNEWTSSSKTENNFRKTVNHKQIKKVKHNFSKLNDNDKFSFSKYEYEGNNKTLSNNLNMLNFFRFNNVVQYVCQGDIRRSTGHIFLLDIPKNTKNNKIKEQFAGKYMISRIHCIFENSSFINDLSIIRSTYEE